MTCAQEKRVRTASLDQLETGKKSYVKGLNLVEEADNDTPNDATDGCVPRSDISDVLRRLPPWER